MKAPWRWHTGRTIRHLVNADGINFAQVSMPAEDRATSEAYIRAGNLIETAPELLEALQAMCACEYGTDAAQAAVRKARAAIKKATR